MIIDMIGHSTMFSGSHLVFPNLATVAVRKSSMGCFIRLNLQVSTGVYPHDRIPEPDLIVLPFVFRRSGGVLRNSFSPFCML